MASCESKVIEHLQPSGMSIFRQFKHPIGITGFLICAISSTQSHIFRLKFHWSFLGCFWTPLFFPETWNFNLLVTNWNGTTNFAFCFCHFVTILFSLLAAFPCIQWEPFPSISWLHTTGSFAVYHLSLFTPSSSLPPMHAPSSALPLSLPYEL